MVQQAMHAPKQFKFALSLWHTKNTCICYECMREGADMSLCPASLGHPLGRGASTIMRHTQMWTWAMHKCLVASWLAATGKHLQMCTRCMSHTVAHRAKDSPSRKAAMPRLATLSPLVHSGLSDVTSPLYVYSYCLKHPNDQANKRVA